MSALEVFMETGIDVASANGSSDSVELSEESVRGMDDMSSFALQFQEEMQ